MSALSSSGSWGHASRGAEINNRRIAALEAEAATKLPITGGTITGMLRAQGGVVTTDLSIQGADAVIETPDAQRPTDLFLRVTVDGVVYRIQLLEEPQ